jgi:hypothetical protein
MPRPDQTRRLAAGAALLCAVAGAPLGATADTTAPDPEVTRALVDWGWQPRQHRAAFLRMARTRRAHLPSGDLLALGDALLRGGEPAASVPLYRTVLARSPDTETAGWAHFALGWIALAAGNVATARRHYETIVAGGWGSRTATAILALVAASAGDGARAVETLDGIANAADTPPTLRLFAMLCGGYARYWSGDYRRAAIAFDVTALAHPTSRLVDDARYGAAWSAYRAGDRAAALSTLRSIAGSRIGPPRGRVDRDLVDLDLRALFRASLRRYEGTPPGNPDDTLVSLVDLDGPALARAALRRAAAEAGAVDAPASGASPAGARGESPPTVRAAPAPGPPEPVPPTMTGGTPGRRPALLLVALAIIAVVTGRFWQPRRRS